MVRNTHLNAFLKRYPGVAEILESRSVSDAIVWRQQNRYGMTWARANVDHITTAHVKMFDANLPRLMKDIKVSSKYARIINQHLCMRKNKTWLRTV